MAQDREQMLGNSMLWNVRPWLAGLWLALITPVVALGQSYHFSVRLTGNEIVPPHPHLNGVGFGWIVLELNDPKNPNDDTLSYALDYSGLTGSPTYVSLHGSADTGKVGVAVVDLDQAKPGQSRGTRIPLRDFQATSLRAALLGVDPTGRSRAYVGIYTAVYPSGEIRGQCVLEQAFEVPHPARDPVARISGGRVIDIELRDRPGGYSAPPLIFLSGGSGSGAVARANLLNGQLHSIEVVEAGAGYLTPPTVEVAPASWRYGEAVIWGQNAQGPAAPPGPVRSLVAIAAGYTHTVALRSDRTVVIWGMNHHGQLEVPTGLGPVKAVAAGFDHSLALRWDGTVAAWGWNEDGQCNVPAGLNSVVAVSAGQYHSVALRADGGVVVWGSNLFGQANVPAGLPRLTAIAAGGAHTLGLTEDGRVVAWGNNQFSQLEVPTELEGVVAIAAGNAHNLALKGNGTVVAWGWNGGSQVVVPEGLQEVSAISAGQDHSVALKRSGEVVLWGSNDYGQTRPPANLGRVTAISAGIYHTDVLVEPEPEISLRPAVLLELRVVPGKEYRLERSADLQTWIPLESTFRADGERVVRSFEVTEDVRYFRLR